MDKQEKTALVSDLSSRLERSTGIFLVEYKGLKVQELNELRFEIKKSEAEMQVVKNRLLKLANQKAKTGLLDEHLKGPTAIALTYEDQAGLAKILLEFAKKNKAFFVKSGQISGKVIDTDGIKRLAALPSRDIMLAQTLSTMQAIPTSFVRVLNGVLMQLLNVLNAIKEDKDKIDDWYSIYKKIEQVRVRYHGKACFKAYIISQPKYLLRYRAIHKSIYFPQIMGYAQK